jgi:hypothetical protein
LRRCPARGHGLCRCRGLPHSMHARAHTHTHPHAHRHPLSPSLKRILRLWNGRSSLWFGPFFADHVLLECTREARLLTRRFSPQDTAAELLPKKRWFRFWRKAPTEEKPQGDSTTPFVITARHMQHAHDTHHKPTTKNYKNTLSNAQARTHSHTHPHTLARTQVCHVLQAHTRSLTTSSCSRLSMFYLLVLAFFFLLQAGYRWFTYCRGRDCSDEKTESDDDK